jgi:hypothetical protein
MDERVAIDKYVVDTYVVGKYRVEEVKVPIFYEQGIWRYKVTNFETGTEFRYIVFVAISTLADPGDIPEVVSAVNSKGKSVVQNWLDRGIEEGRVAIVGRMGIEELTESEWQIHGKKTL